MLIYSKTWFQGEMTTLHDIRAITGPRKSDLCCRDVGALMVYTVMPGTGTKISDILVIGYIVCI